MNTSRNTKTYRLENDASLEQILNWCRRFNPCVILNSNSDKQIEKDIYGKFDLIIAADSLRTLEQDKNVFSELKKNHSEISDWLFGFISYDVKNSIENLHSKNHDGIGSPEYYFFQPKYIFEFSEKTVSVHFFQKDENEVDGLIEKLINQEPDIFPMQSLTIKARVDRDEYIKNINAIKKHISRGDIYEMNYCMEFFAENAEVDPLSVYGELNSLSPMPFSTYFQSDEIYLMSASPERFLAKRKNKIISQPIKGTARRGKNEIEDRRLADELKKSPKEQSENVMIVDLVRNDLSRTATKGSVFVEELFGVKTFKQLHHLISTIVSELKTGVHFTEVIRDAFPMGSMTGAPKIRAMEIIEEYEKAKRGIYSGTVGYITPDGDFDFNVVIRSILYNSKTKYLSFMAGSAITDAGVAEKEFDECMLKANAMKRVLTDPKFATVNNNVVHASK